MLTRILSIAVMVSLVFCAGCQTTELALVDLGFLLVSEIVDWAVGPADPPEKANDPNKLQDTEPLETPPPHD
jgi:hypothetical protein